MYEFSRVEKYQAIYLCIVTGETCRWLVHHILSNKFLLPFGFAVAMGEVFCGLVAAFPVGEASLGIKASRSLDRSLLLLVLLLLLPLFPVVPLAIVFHSDAGFQVELELLVVAVVEAGALAEVVATAAAAEEEVPPDGGGAVEDALEEERAASRSDGPAPAPPPSTRLARFTAYFSYSGLFCL